MAQYMCSVIIKRPIGDVFAFVEDPDHYPHWAEGIREMVLVESDRVVSGAKVRRTASRFGMKVETDGTVKVYEMNRRSVWTFNRPYPVSVQHTYHPLDGDTRFTQVMEAELSGIRKWLSPLLLAEARWRQRNSLHRLKNLLESASDM